MRYSCLITCLSQNHWFPSYSNYSCSKSVAVDEAAEAAKAKAKMAEKADAKTAEKAARVKQKADADAALAALKN